MAKAKKTQQPAVRQYKVKEHFTGWYNNRRFDHKKGDVVEMNADEAITYRRFIEETTK